MRSNRGEVVTLVLVVCGLLGATQLVPNWRPSHWFANDEVAENAKRLTEAQTALSKAQLEAKQAQDTLKALNEAERAKERAQAQFGHQMVVGASKALESATPAPETALARSLLSRANIALALAIGELPPDKQTEVFQIVAQTLSGAQADLEAANKKLAEMDKALAVTTNERDALKTRIPKMETELANKEALVVAKSTEVAAKTQDIVATARKLKDEVDRSGSAGALVEKLGWVIGILVSGYLFLAYVLPVITQGLNAGALKNCLRGLSGWILNPVHHVDARKTIDTLRDQIV